MDKVLADGKRIVLEACRYCGAPRCLAAGKRATYCKACGERMRRYYQARSALIKHPCNENSERLKAIMDEYKALKARGYKVPPGVV